MEPPYVVIIAGPNGVGKSTYAVNLLALYPTCSAFVNADLIAMNIQAASTPERDVQAGRLTLLLFESLVEQGASFMLETTLSGRALASRLADCKQRGYTIIMHYLHLPDIRILTGRVAHRVATGGHDIPIVDQQRRHLRSYKNFLELYCGLCNEWTLYDASDRIPREIAGGPAGSLKGSAPE